MPEATKEFGDSCLAPPDTQAFTVLRPSECNSMVSKDIAKRNSVVKEDLMPGKKHVRGVSAKEQREYEHIKESAERSGDTVAEPRKWLHEPF